MLEKMPMGCSSKNLADDFTESHVVSLKFAIKLGK